jgi:hypothetical protein
MDYSFGQMLATLVAALAHDVPEQHGALGGSDHVVAEQAEGVRRVLWLGRGHLLLFILNLRLLVRWAKRPFACRVHAASSLVYPCRNGVGANGLKVRHGAFAKNM